MKIERGQGFKMANKKGTSTVRSRCQEGWRLFFQIGDEYTSVINVEPQGRDWSRHRRAVEKHKGHIEDCEICRPGLKELQMTLEEVAVDDVGAGSY